MMEASTPKNIQCTRYEGIVCCIVARIYDEILHPALYLMQEFGEWCHYVCDLCGLAVKYNALNG